LSPVSDYLDSRVPEETATTLFCHAGFADIDSYQLSTIARLHTTSGQ